MNRITCPDCEGRTHTTVMVPNVRKYGGVEYVDPNPPLVPRHFVCQTCRGTGRIPSSATTDAQAA